MPIHFLHIRKTGGTAIAEALRPIAAEFNILLHDHATRLSDIPRHDQVVFFVRHPIPRFASGFFSRLRCGLPRHHYPWNEIETRAFRLFRKPSDLAEALSSPDQQMADAARQAMRGISHLKNTYKDWFSGERELDDRADSILLIGLQEKLTSDFEYLRTFLKLPETVRLPQDEVLAHKTPSEFDRNLSPLAEHNLRHWYRDDIRFYEHCLRLRAARGL